MIDKTTLLKRLSVILFVAALCCACSGGSGEVDNCDDSCRTLDDCGLDYFATQEVCYSDCQKDMAVDSLYTIWQSIHRCTLTYSTDYLCLDLQNCVEEIQNFTKVLPAQKCTLHSDCPDNAYCIKNMEECTADQNAIPCSDKTDCKDDYACDLSDFEAPDDSSKGRCTPE